MRPSIDECVTILDGFNPHSELLSSKDEAIPLWNPPSEISTVILTGHTSTIRAVAFSPNGSTLVSGTDFDRIRLWDVASGALIDTLEGTDGAIQGRSVAFTTAGKRIAAGGGNGIFIWDQVPAELADLSPNKHWKPTVALTAAGSSFSIAFSPNSSLLASGSQSGQVQVWESSSRTLLWNLKGHASAVTGVTFSLDGGLLASSSKDGTVRL